MTTFNSFALGCRVNKAEIENLDKSLISYGYTKTSINPDIFIINSCAVTGKAQRETTQLINAVNRNTPRTKVILTGCAATNWLKLQKTVIGVDYLVDNFQKEYLSELILKRYDKDNSQKKISNLNRKPVPMDLYDESKRVLIKIQDGCHRFCSYCIVPYLRGTPKSYKISQIIKTINSYRYHSEVILTAINTESFGIDTKETLTELIQSVIDDTKIKRISFGSIHPWSINNKLIETYKAINNNARLVKFFHIPLQSGSNRILLSMKRGYTREEILEKLNAIDKIDPFTFIGTDIITGYLDESDSDFEDTLSFLTKAPISKFHVFRFSKREHTAAFYLANRLKEPSPQIKKQRSKTLRTLSEHKLHSFARKHIGHAFEALFLKRNENGYTHTLLNDQFPALIKSEKDFTGQIKNVKIESYCKGNLIGKIV